MLQIHFFFFPKLSATSTTGKPTTSYEAAIFDCMELCNVINNSALSCAVFKLACKCLYSVFFFADLTLKSMRRALGGGAQLKSVVFIPDLTRMLKRAVNSQSPDPPKHSRALISSDARRVLITPTFFFYPV